MCYAVTTYWLSQRTTNGTVAGRELVGDQGHVEVRDVYWYLSAVPELMNIVGQRFEDFAAHSPAGER